MVRRTDRNRINIATGHNFTEITIFTAILVAIALINNLRRCIQAVAVHITHTHHLDGIGRQKRPHVSIALTTLTNRGHHDLIIRSKCSGGNDGRETNHGSCAHQ